MYSVFQSTYLYTKDIYKLWAIWSENSSFIDALIKQAENFLRENFVSFN